MLIRTKAVVLHSVKYADNSVIMYAFTEEHGKMAYIINGVKSKKAVLRSALLQPLSIIDIETYFDPKKDIQRIKESRVAFPFSSIPFDSSKNALALFIAELLYRTIKETHTDKQLYGFLENSIQTLDTTMETIGNFHLIFLIKMSKYLGFELSMRNLSEGSYFDLTNGVFTDQIKDAHCLSLEDSKALSVLLRLSFRNMGELVLPKQQKVTLLRALISYYKHHSHSFSSIKSVDILLQIFT